MTDPTPAQAPSLEDLEPMEGLILLVAPRSWIVVLAFALLAAGALVWGFFGRATDTLSGQGILTRRGGLIQVDMPCSGEIAQVTVKPGDLVAAGQLLAQVARPELEASLRDAEGRLENLRLKRRGYQPILAGEQQAQSKSLDDQERRARVAAKAWGSRVASLVAQLASLRKAAARGLVTPEQVEQGAQELAEAQDRQADAEARVPQLKGDWLSQDLRRSEQTFQLEREIRDASDRVDALRLKLDLEGRLRAPSSGRVLEVVHRAGDRLPLGNPVIRLEGLNQPLTCYLFVPGQGRRVRPPMAAALDPDGVKREEFGSMVGKVVSVSPGPMGVEAIAALLRNPRLADQLGGKGNAYLVEIDLVPDPGTPSGYRWTSRQGPPLAIGTGTLVTGEIRVLEQPPITLVVPALRRWLLGA